MKVNVSYFANINFAQEEDNQWTVEEEEMAISLAKALKAIRKYKGLSLNEVSKKTEIPFQTIARYESGENIPSIIQAYKLAYFYDFSINDLFIIGLLEGIETDYKDIFDNWGKRKKDTHWE